MYLIHYTELNYPDRDLDRQNFVPCKHSIWIVIYIILIQILGQLQCNNEEQCDALCCIEQ